MKRRDFTKLISAMALSLGGTKLMGANTIKPSKTKRVIFFLQNHGFEPTTCISDIPNASCSLNSIRLAPHMKLLEPYKDRMHVVMGLHGRHTSPSHSACFGALGGYRGGMGVPPSAPTIDHVLSRHLPQTALSHLCIGMDSMEAMQGRPTTAALSAIGPSQPIFMHSNPVHLYQLLFGSVSSGDLNKQYNVRSKLLVDIEDIAKQNAMKVAGTSKDLYGNFVGGLRSLNTIHEKLSTASDALRKFKPKYDDRYTNPEFETDWHDCLLEIGIAALQANLTNVLTIGSGRGKVAGAWKGLGITTTGHNLGHMKQTPEDIWKKIRGYNCQMLVKIIKAMEIIPEGNGSMMDNTLIVYTSDNGPSQHTNGNDWPFVLIGNGGGAFKTGQFSLIKDRPLNDLYSSFLHGIGKPVDQFNISKKLAFKNNSQGPIKELLV